MVDYYLKYLKYKNKYLKLVNIYGGSDKAEAEAEDESELQDSNSTSQVPLYGNINFPSTEVQQIITSNNAITKFITYNTIEQNLATLLNGRSITTFPAYADLNNMFKISLGNKVCSFADLVGNMFTNYLSPENLGNEEKDKTRYFYNNNEYKNINEISSLLKKAYGKLDEIYFTYNISINNNIFPTFADLINSILNNQTEFKVYNSKGENINIYTIIYNNNPAFTKIITQLKDNNSILQNKSLRLPLVLGRIIDAITTNSIAAVEEISQCLFIPFNYNNSEPLTLLEHINNKFPDISYCCIINPDYKGPYINKYIMNDDNTPVNITYWGGAALFIPCNYFTNITLEENVYYVLTITNTKNTDTRHSTYNFTYSDINNNISKISLKMHFNPSFLNYLLMSVIMVDTPTHNMHIEKKEIRKPSYRTIMTIYHPMTNTYIISGHFESDSNDTKNQDLKKNLFNKIKALITERMLITKKHENTLKYYIIGDFNYEGKQIKSQFTEPNYKIHYNNLDYNFTSYEDINTNTNTIKPKLIDYLITNPHVDELVIPIKNSISYNLLSQTGTDHKMVSFYVIPNGSKLLNENINIYISHDSTYTDWPIDLKIKYQNK